MSGGLVHPLLAEWSVPHGFGTRGAPGPPDLARPKQVHGRDVATLDANGAVRPAQADAIVAASAGARVGVVTADCVPILVSNERGTRVAAVHAGWRGLASGVIEAALETLARAGEDPSQLRAAIGPCIGRCCYEIDAPVVDALRPRFGAALDEALTPVGDLHHRLDLVALACASLARGGLRRASIGVFARACTHCEPERFHSYRRDGPGAGRLVHWIEVRASQG